MSAYLVIDLKVCDVRPTEQGGDGGAVELRDVQLISKTAEAVLQAGEESSSRPQVCQAVEQLRGRQVGGSCQVEGGQSEDRDQEIKG